MDAQLIAAYAALRRTVRVWLRILQAFIIATMMISLMAAIWHGRLSDLVVTVVLIYPLVVITQARRITDAVD